MKEARGARLTRLILLFHLQHRAGFDERRQRAKERNQCRLLREAFVEPPHEGMEKRSISNHLPKLAKLVADGFDALAEDANGAIALRDGAKLGVESRNAGVAIVLEEAAELGPDVASGGAVGDHEVEQLGGDAGVEPLNNGEVVLEPAWIVRSRRSITGDMVEERASSEMDLEKMTPVIIVVAVKVEDDRDERGNVCDGVAEGEGGGDGESGGGG